jgi:hypothetical protein
MALGPAVRRPGGEGYTLRLALVVILDDPPLRPSQVLGNLLFWWLRGIILCANLNYLKIILCTVVLALSAARHRRLVQRAAADALRAWLS